MAAAKQPSSDFSKGAMILQGVLAILFGIAAVFWPGITTLTLVYIFGAFLLIDGVVLLVMGLMNLRDFGRAILMLILGLFELGIGLYLLRNPKVAFGTLIIILGFALIIRGIFGFVHAFTWTNDSGAMRTLNGILGALGIIIGIVILRQPVAGGLAFVWILGLYALIAGPVMIAQASDMSKPKR
jgi:uncharacterized membrane protein HdeD (DUF308 family)